jgi:ribonuclease HI
MEDLDLLPWQECMQLRKISVKDGRDILWWGHSTLGVFSVKEAYHLLTHPPNQAPEGIWGKVWQPFLWPKISLFLWLTTQNRILTWDNLIKRDFIGPSRCPLCQQNEETLEHLLNNCHYSQQIWDWGAQVMRRSQRIRGSIRDTLGNWGTSPFHNPILQRIWQLLPGFSLWAIWKERNQRIFNSKSSPPTSTWEKIKGFIRETILSNSWLQDDIQCKPQERLILEGWNPHSRINTQGKTFRGHDSSPTVWTPPPYGFLKLNFDGASMGNLGPAGFGAVLRDNMGKITHMTAGFLGESTNNVAEITSLLRGLQTATQHLFLRLIIEGDSQVIIQLILKILHGQSPGRISPSWKLFGLLEDFEGFIHPNLTLIPVHVKREANKVADHLENAGIDSKENPIYWQANVSEETDLSMQCKELAGRDFPAPDGVTRGRMECHPDLH